MAICTEGRENRPAGIFLHGLSARQRLFARNSVQVVKGPFSIWFTRIIISFHFVSFIYFGMSQSLEQITYLHIILAKEKD